MKTASREPKPRPAQRHVLNNIAAGRRLAAGLHGMSAAGGLTSTVASLHRNGWIDENENLTEAGKAAREAPAGLYRARPRVTFRVGEAYPNLEVYFDGNKVGSVLRGQDAAGFFWVWNTFFNARFGSSLPARLENCADAKKGVKAHLLEQGKKS